MCALLIFSTLEQTTVKKRRFLEGVLKARWRADIQTARVGSPYCQQYGGAQRGHAGQIETAVARQEHI